MIAGHAEHLMASRPEPIQKYARLLELIGLKGDERVTIPGLAHVKPREVMTITITRADGSTLPVPVLCRIDTLDELEYFKSGGILHYVLRNLAA